MKKFLIGALALTALVGCDQQLEWHRSTTITRLFTNQIV